MEPLEPRLLLAETFWQIWAPPDPSPGVDVGQFSSMKLDANGDPHVSYYDATNGDLKYVKGDAATRTWSAPVVVDSGGDVGMFSSLALDSSDNPHIGYYDATNTALKYAWYDGVAWNIDTVDNDGAVGEFCSLALDSADIPHFSYYDAGYRALMYATVGVWNPWDTYTLDTGAIGTVPTNPGWVGTYTSIALDAGDNPHITYYDVINGAVKYIDRKGGFWESGFVDGATEQFLYESEGTHMEDQTVAPGDWENPTRVVPITWEEIGHQVTIASNTLTVKLTDDANGTVVADAIRIVGPAGDIIINDGQAGGFSQTGVWPISGPVTGAYPSVWPTFAGTYRTHAGGGTGLNSVEWTFSGVAPGKYNIFATWLAAPGLATDATYTIYDGVVLPTADQNQRVAPVDWADPAAVAPIHWEQLIANASVVSGTLVVQLGQSATGAVMADAIRVVNRATGAVFAIMNDGQAGFLASGSWVAASGAGGYGNDYLTHPVGAGPDLAVWTFAGVPAGNYDVYATWLGNATFATDAPFEVLDGAASKGTALVNQIFDPNDVDDPAQVIGLTWDLIGGNVTVGEGFLTVTLTDQTGAANNVIADAVRIVQQGVAPPADIIIDNGMLGYTDNGTWAPVAGVGGYANDYRTRLGGGAGQNAASWNFTGLAAGTYDVFATWVAAPANVTDAPYTISTRREVGTSTKSQRSAPNDWTNPTQVDSFFWELIGPPVNIQYGALSVDVFDSPYGNVQADAVRIVGPGVDMIVDNDGGTYQMLGPDTWTYVGGSGGWWDDYRELGPGIGWNLSDYYFTILNAAGLPALPSGTYNVYASWQASAANSDTVYYAIIDGIRGNYRITGMQDDVGEFTSVALDLAGKPHMIYHALRTAGGATLQDLRYATLMQSGDPTLWVWNVSTVADVGDVGEFGSLVLDGANRPHATYLDYGNGDLMYVYWDGNSWITELVDDVGWDAPVGPALGQSVGFTTSLQLGDNGLGYVSYFNYSNHTLTFASQNANPTLTAIDTLGGAAPLLAFEDTPYTITYDMLANAANESDAEGDPISFRVESVTTGTLTQDGLPVIPGSTVLSNGGSPLVWTPDVDASGVLNAFAVVAWTAPEPGAATTNSRAISLSPVQVKVYVLPLNDAPTLSMVSTLTGAVRNTPFVIPFVTLATAADEADRDGDTLSFRIESVTSGTLTRGGIPVVPGTTLFGAGEQLVWTPPASATGVRNAFTIVAWDGQLASSPVVQVSVDVTLVNSSPTLTVINTLTGATEDTPFVITYGTLAAAANEDDADGDPIHFRIESLTAGTTLTKLGVPIVPTETLLSAGEQLVWTPALDANGVLPAFTVRAFDGTSASAAPVQVNVDVAPVNDAPTLTTVTPLAGATRNTPFGITYAALLAAADEADVDGDPLSFRVAAVTSGTLTQGGVAVVPGTTLLTAASQPLVWTPATDTWGVLDAFTVVAWDGQLPSSPAVQVSVDVNLVNSPPTLTVINTLTGAAEDTPFVITYGTLAAAANEADPDGDAISFRIESLTAGTLTKMGVPIVTTETLLSAGEQLVWTPALDANGILPAFTVRAWDGSLASAAAVQVNVNVAPVNDAPTLTLVNSLAGGIEDIPYSITYAALLAAADEADVDGDTLSFRIAAVSTGTLTQGGVAVVPGTTLLTAASQPLIWTPPLDSWGLLDAFTVVAWDGVLPSAAPAQVRVTVAENNAAPTLTVINTLTGASPNTPFTITYATIATAANEADPDGDAISFRIQSVTSGTLTKGGIPVVPTETLLGIGEQLIWTPAPGASGVLGAFTVVAWDGRLASAAPVQVNANVIANNAPTLTAINNLVGSGMDTAVSIPYAKLLAASNLADLDAGDPLSFRIQAVSSGTLTKGGVPIIPGTTLLSAGDTIVWTPALGAGGVQPAFTVVGWDGAAASAAPVQVNVDVTPVNRAPTLTTISTLTGGPENSSNTITYAALAAAANEADVEGDPISFRVEAVSSGTLTQGGVAVVPGTTLLSAASLPLVWTPAAGMWGMLDAFTVVAWDGALPSAAPVQVRVDVAAVNDRPTLTGMATLTGGIQNTPFTITYDDLSLAAIGLGDPDGDPISFRVRGVTSGSLRKIGAPSIVPGVTFISAGEAFVWTPALNAYGTLNAFSVEAYDGAASSTTPVQVKVQVAQANGAPTLTVVNTLTGAAEDTPYTITHGALATAANEADPDGDPVSFRVEAISSGTLTQGGVAVLPGTTLLTAASQPLVWMPAAGTWGLLNAFTVVAWDGALPSAAPVQVRVDVAESSHAPTLTLVNTLTGAAENTPFTITYAALAAAANEADPDGDPISFRVQSVTSGTLTKGGVPVVPGTTLFGAGEQLVWTPALNANGVLPAFTVRAFDGTSASAAAVPVTIDVSPANRPPTLTLVNNLAGGMENTPYTITYAALAAAANEADADGNPISFRVGAVSTGTVTQGGVAVVPGTTLLTAASQPLVWTPAANVFGTLNAFTVVAWDGALPSATPVQVKVQVAAAVPAPDFIVAVLLKKGKRVKLTANKTPNIPVLISNIGNLASYGTVGLDLFVSASATFDPATATQIGAATLDNTRKALLPGGKPKKLKFHGVTPPVLPAGFYYVFVRINPTQAVTELNYLNNVTRGAVQLEWV